MGLPEEGVVGLVALGLVVLIAIPLLIQVYFNSGLAYGLMKWLQVPHDVAAPGALIGASNFFELAVATAVGGLRDTIAAGTPPPRSAWVSARRR